MDKQDRGSIIGKGVIVPTAAVGIGLLGGSIAGGALANALAKSPGIAQKISRMNPAQKKAYLDRIAMFTTPVGGIAGAGLGHVVSSNMQKQIKLREAAQQKTAMYAAFFDELGDYLL